MTDKDINSSGIEYKVRRRGSQPQVGDKIWIEGFKNANGSIVRITYEEQEAIAIFKDWGGGGGSRQVTFHFDEIADRWTDAFGGSYMIEQGFEEL